MTEVHLTTEQLAARWKVHVVTLNKKRCEGTGPKFLKIGKRVLYPLKEVEIFEKSHTVKNTAGG